MLFVFSLVVLMVGIFYHIKKRKFEKPYLLIWLWAIAPFVLATLPGLKVGSFEFPFRSIFYWRYLVGSSIPLSMIIVHGLQKMPKNIFVASMVILIALSVMIDLATFSKSPDSFREAYQVHILPKIAPSDKIVTVLPAFAEVLYYRNRNGINNDLVVLPEGLVQSSGKRLLDAYVANGKVTIDATPKTRYFNTGQGQKVELVTPTELISK